MKRFFALCLLALTLGVCLFSCSEEKPIDLSKNDASIILEKIKGSEKWQTAVDYSDAANWLACESGASDKRADVIYFYPEIYAAGENGNEVCGIDNAEMRAKAPGYLETQAAVFTDECRLFAPYYRQIDLSFLRSLKEIDKERAFQFAASKDAAAALDVYFEKYNDGRPFILAGHGQGSDIVRRLVADYLPSKPDLQKRMIAAYAIGCAVTEGFVKDYRLKFASGEEDLGVIVSYNTEGQDNYDYDNAYVSANDTLVINPVRWTTKPLVSTDEKYHLGTRIKDGENIVELTFGTHIYQKHGTVICEDNEIAERYALSDEADTELYGRYCLHRYDYELFFNNLKANVKTRVDAYFAK